jgi:hypothetical protein
MAFAAGGVSFCGETWDASGPKRRRAPSETIHARQINIFHNFVEHIYRRLYDLSAASLTSTLHRTGQRQEMKLAQVRVAVIPCQFQTPLDLVFQNAEVMREIC